MSYFPDDLSEATAPIRPVPQILNAAADAGVEQADPFPAMQAHLDRAKAIRHHPIDQEDRRTSIAQRIGRGELDLEAGLDEALTAHLRTTGVGTMKEVLVAASKAAEACALDELRPWVQADERLVVQVLAPVIAEALERVVSTIVDIPERVVDAQQASAAGPRVAGAWSDLESAWRTWGAVHRLANKLRANKFLPTPALYEDYTNRRGMFSPTDHAYARPDLLPPRLKGPLTLPSAIAAGALPGIYTAAEVEEHLNPLLPELKPVRQGRIHPPKPLGVTTPYGDWVA